MFDRLNVYYDEQRSAPLNMAVDEALLERATTSAIRFYGWTRPAVSFGYFARFEEAAKCGEGRDLVRRWTGGGIVLHGIDLTYSIVVPARNRYLVRSAIDLYSAVHSAIREVLIGDGIHAMLANGASEKVSDECFANPVHWDVLIDGQKIAGAAQRRTRAGLLQQGSIQCEALPARFAERFARKLAENFSEREIGGAILKRAEKIAAEKYGTDKWLRRR